MWERIRRTIAWRSSALRWRLVRLVAGRHQVRSRGLWFTLQDDNWITHYRWRTYDTKEPETLDWLDQVVRDGDLIFDVGANIGVYTVYAALRHPGSRVVAFEPEYANLHLLRDNVIANGLTDRIDVYALALADAEGLTRVHVQDLTPGAALHTVSTHRIERTRTGKPVVWTEGIYAMTLDRFCEQRSIWPNALKIDVDGTEPEILAGARKALQEPALRSVCIELPEDGRSADACLRILADCGLRPLHDHRRPNENLITVR